MNREKFEKMVRPYLSSTKYPHKSLVEEKFEKQQSNYILGSHYISEENKLLYIPTPTYGKGKGIFVFSDELGRYSYNGSLPALLDEWATHWSDGNRWIHLKEPISDMNGGKGWSGEPYYFTLEDPHLFNYMNWINVNPLEVKQ